MPVEGYIPLPKGRADHRRWWRDTKFINTYVNEQNKKSPFKTFKLKVFEEGFGEGLFSKSPSPIFLIIQILIIQTISQERWCLLRSTGEV